MSRPVRTALTIAGSDSGGGAGVQADVKAFAAAGVHGMTAITALTAQSTVGVTGVHPVPPEFVVEQVRTVADDLGVDAVKTGMLGAAATVRAACAAIDLLPAGTPVVVDPVMVAESGARLLDEDAVRAVVEELLPRATVITPNVPEALALCAALGEPVADGPDAAEEAARILWAAMGRAPGTAGTADAQPPDAVGEDVAAGASSSPTDRTGAAEDDAADRPRLAVVTGGHREELVDVAFDGVSLHRLPGERQADGAAHGSGCTHASTLAAHLARGAAPLDAARAAQAAASRAVRDGLRPLGDGAGPVDVLGVVARARQVAAGAREPATDLS